MGCVSSCYSVRVPSSLLCGSYLDTQCVYLRVVLVVELPSYGSDRRFILSAESQRTCSIVLGNSGQLRILAMAPVSVAMRTDVIVCELTVNDKVHSFRLTADLLIREHGKSWLCLQMRNSAIRRLFGVQTGAGARPERMYQASSSTSIKQLQTARFTAVYRHIAGGHGRGSDVEAGGGSNTVNRARFLGSKKFATNVVSLPAYVNIRTPAVTDMEPIDMDVTSSTGEREILWVEATLRTSHG